MTSEVEPLQKAQAEMQQKILALKQEQDLEEVEVEAAYSVLSALNSACVEKERGRCWQWVIYTKSRTKMLKTAKSNLLGHMRRFIDSKNV